LSQGGAWIARKHCIHGGVIAREGGRSSSLRAIWELHHAPIKVSGLLDCPLSRATTAWGSEKNSSFDTAGPVVTRNRMDRFIDAIEWVAAIFVGIVAADIFLSVLLRYFFSTSIPDSYNFGQLLLGILIFWGIAATSYRGGHITVDLVWANVGPRRQRVIDVFATLVLLFVVTVQTYTLLDKVIATRDDNILTVDLHLPTWPFFAVAWAGDVSAVLLIAIRTWRLVFHPEKLHAGGPQAKAVE
jgi:TRAP-type transport system small permease protein